MNHNFKHQLPKYSIIIPVYNVEKYLEQCVDSVLNQSFSDYEIILVDDGSPDQSGKICDEYADGNSKIKVLHQKNQGQSSARNAGIKQAEGEYIIFLDSDDFWGDSNGLQYINNIIESGPVDLLLFGVDDYYSDKETYKLARGHYDEKKSNDLKKDSIISHLFTTKNFPGSVWMLVVNKKLLLNHHIFFREKVSAEDFEWLYLIFKYATIIKVADVQLYMYRTNVNGSLSSKPRISGNYGMHYCIKRRLIDNDGYHPDIDKWIVRTYLLSLLNYGGLSKKDQSKVFSIVDADKEILNIDSSFKVKLFKLAVEILGVSRVANYLYALYRLIKN